MTDGRFPGLSFAEVVSLHDAILMETGGARGILNRATLEAALARPYLEAFGHTFFPDPFLKAAALAHAIAHDHPFVDGNKRTALLASMILLEQHGWTFPIREHYEDGYERVQALAVNDGFEAYACWLRKYAQCTGAG